jgi:hypothetical protein
VSNDEDIFRTVENFNQVMFGSPQENIVNTCPSVFHFCQIPVKQPFVRGVAACKPCIETFRNSMTLQASQEGTIGKMLQQHRYT